MSDEVWNVDVKADATEALRSAYDHLADVLDCAEEMADEVVAEHVSKAQETINDLITFLDVRR